MIMRHSDTSGIISHHDFSIPVLLCFLFNVSNQLLALSCIMEISSVSGINIIVLFIYVSYKSHMLMRH